MIHQDELLRQAVAQFHDKGEEINWKQVAQRVGNGDNNDQCIHRWNYYAKPELKDRNRGVWSDEEVKSSLHDIIIMYYV